ncbi:hypothetical protein MHYP_G00260910 [Metynnis hypsauchen]
MFAKRIRSLLLESRYSHCLKGDSQELPIRHFGSALGLAAPRVCAWLKNNTRSHNPESRSGLAAQSAETAAGDLPLCLSRSLHPLRKRPGSVLAAPPGGDLGSDLRSPGFPGFPGHAAGLRPRAAPTPPLREEVKQGARAQGEGGASGSTSLRTTHSCSRK